MIALSDDLLDCAEDIANVLAFFKNQKAVFDNAVSIRQALYAEREYMQADDDMLRALSTVGMIIGMAKPYQRISELPALIQSLQAQYAKLMEAKREDVLSEIQAAMGEIHQTATLDQKAIVQKADDALDGKKKAMLQATTLTQLDTMKIQIDNIRQQYLKLIFADTSPNASVNTATAGRANICYTATLKSEDDIDKYLVDVKKKLMNLLDGHDALHII